MEWWRIIVILVIILASGFFSSGETAITGVNRIRLKHKAETGNLAAKRALKLLEKYDMMLATLLIGNNIVTLVVASVSTLFAVDLAASMNWDEALTVAVVTAILTVILIVFSDILPKTVAREHADDFILICSKALAVTVWIFIPLTALTLLFQRGVTRLFRKGSKEVSVTEQELMQIIDEIEDEGVLEEHESDLVRSALEFDETTVEEIMTPRVNIIAVAKTDSASEVCNVFFDEGYSRLPVYDGSPDKIVGLLSSKKFMKWFATEHSESGGNAPLPIQDIVKLPTLMKLSDALKSLQRKKSHLAVVLDQYGGTAGIVTLEDILEELVGEIQDESDDESGETAASVKFVKEDVFEVNGELSINDFNRFFEDFDGGNKNYSDIEITSESITIGGWVFEVFGKIPNVGETKSSGRFKVTVLSMEGRRPGRIKLDLTLSQPHKQSKTQAAD